MSHESAADAVTSVFRSSHQWLVRYAASFVGSIDAAEDVVQEALMLLYAELRGGRRIDNTRAWTATVVRRRAAHVGAELRAISPLSEESGNLSALGAGPNTAARDLEAESSTVGQLIERAQVIDMPIESRRAAALVRLTGAVVFRNESGTGEQIPYFSIAGGRSQNQMGRLDGTSVQNAAIGVAQIGLNPSAESLQEFKVEINNLAAEYGRTGGGFIPMTTRSGTNEFRGAAYEFLRNEALDARTFFTPSIRRRSRPWDRGTSAPPLVRSAADRTRRLRPHRLDRPGHDWPADSARATLRVLKPPARDAL